MIFTRASHDYSFSQFAVTQINPTNIHTLCNHKTVKFNEVFWTHALLTNRRGRDGTTHVSTFYLRTAGGGTGRHMCLRSTYEPQGEGRDDTYVYVLLTNRRGRDGTTHVSTFYLRTAGGGTGRHMCLRSTYEPQGEGRDDTCVYVLLTNRRGRDGTTHVSTFYLRTAGVGTGRHMCLRSTYEPQGGTGRHMCLRSTYEPQGEGRDDTCVYVLLTNRRGRDGTTHVSTFYLQKD